MVIIEAPETLSIAIIITIDNHYNNFLQGIKRLILLLYSLVLTRSCRCEGNLAAGLYLLVAGGWCMVGTAGVRAGAQSEPRVPPTTDR